MQLRRSDIILRPNQNRMLFRPFQFESDERAREILSRVLGLTELRADRLLEQTLEELGGLPGRLRDFFQRRFVAVTHLLDGRSVSPNRQLLIGAYFSQEYAFESSALFNPSLVWSTDQSGLPPDSKRFILSLRATGEGHISSITFRTGVIDGKLEIAIDEPTGYVTPPEPICDSTLEKKLFERKLIELDLANGFSTDVLAKLGQTFSAGDLEQALTRTLPAHRSTAAQIHAVADGIRSLAKANYCIAYTSETEISQRIIFPQSPHETNGIEDSRFVQFTDDDGSQRYIATYTAFNGRVVFPQLIETDDFLRFNVSTLNGPQAKGKGMALFPRRINGQYAMLGRQDGQNISLMYSDNHHFWHNRQTIVEPTEPWEFVQLGNCGSPIETDRGWLVLTHGVGPMRKYVISAVMLDLEDPSQVIGRLRQPLLTPTESERRGYVPNVVYSCGGQIHNGHLVLPYAMSDYASSFATVPLEELMAAME